MSDNHSSPPLNPIMTQDTSPDSTLALLDDLVDFYQRERAWIHQTRHALDSAFKQEEKLDCAEETESSLSSSAHTDSISNNGGSDEEQSKQKQQSPPTSKWEERKKRFKLRLDKYPLNSHRPVSLKPARPIVSLSDLHQRKQVLDMLDQMMEARLESCQRVSQLVRNTSAADFPYS